jgi:hypothetical protein
MKRNVKDGNKKWRRIEISLTYIYCLILGLNKLKAIIFLPFLFFANNIEDEYDFDLQLNIRA